MHEQPRTSTLAIISLVFGILGWVGLPIIGSLVAIVTGHIARTKIRQSFNSIQGDGLAVAGLLLGWVPIVLSLLWIALATFVFAGFITGSITLLVLGFVMAVFMITFVLA